MKVILNKSFTLLLLVCLCVGVTSCKKDEVNNVDNSVVGLWKGPYVVGAYDPVNAGKSYDISWALYPDNTATYYSNSIFGRYFGSGTWELTGETLTMKMRSTKDPSGVEHNQTFTAKYVMGAKQLTDGEFMDANGSFGTFTSTKLK